MALAQENDVRLDVRRGDAGKSSLRKPDRAQEVRLGSDVLARFVGPCVQRVAGGDEADQAARSHQVERTPEKVIVDAEPAVRPVAQVGNLVPAERHVGDREVEPVVGQRRSFKRRDAHIHPTRRVERLEHATGEVIDLDRGNAASFGDRARHRTDEMTHAG